MDAKLLKIIRASTYEVQAGWFVYIKVKSVPKRNDYFMLTKDANEITVVTRAENLKGLKAIERNKDLWKLIALNVAVPFYSVGFLVAVSQAIADQGIDILIVSTYSKDYIMVKKRFLDKAEKALLSLGLKEK